jgi:RNase P/RNase MRP subunit POP5
MRKNRHRYLLFRLHKEKGSIDEKDLSIAIWRSLLSLYGEIQAADSRLYLTEFDEKEGVGILHCNAESLPQVIASAAMIGSINGVNVSFEPKKTSGTIKSLSR